MVFVWSHLADPSGRVVCGSDQAPVEAVVVAVPKIVFDTESGIDVSTLSAIESATDLVFVSSMEMELLTDLEFMPVCRHIVVNFADRHSGVNVREVETKIRIPVDVLVPRTFDVAVAANLGHPIVETRSRGPVAKAIGQLVTRIREDKELDISSKHRGIEVA